MASAIFEDPTAMKLHCYNCFLCGVSTSHLPGSHRPQFDGQKALDLSARSAHGFDSLPIAAGPLTTCFRYDNFHFVFPCGNNLVAPDVDPYVSVEAETVRSYHFARGRNACHIRVRGE